MAIIRPFRAQRFTAAAGPLEDLVAPPYDVISPREREDLGSRSVHNSVWITLPEQLPDDRSQFVRYGRSASRLAEWRRDGTLAVDDEPAIYLYRQSFADPRDNSSHTRTCLIVLLKTEPYEKGVVLPHEQTFPKHKEDRLRVLEATRSHLECIYGLYKDDLGAVARAVDVAPAKAVADVTTEDGVRHELGRIEDMHSINTIQAAFEAERIWIADGHHRYETARTFRESTGVRNGFVAEDFLLIGLSSMRDPGLVLLPTHRIVVRTPLSPDEAKQRLEPFFAVEAAPNQDLPALTRAAQSSGKALFGVALPGGIGLLAVARDANQLIGQAKGEEESLLDSLDVTILHTVILERCFGIEGLDRIEYTRDPAEAIARVNESRDTIAVITNPPSVDDMRRVAEAGQKMPQKSTYYYPKLLSGLVFWSMADMDAE